MVQIRTIENIDMNELALQLDTLLDVQHEYEQCFAWEPLEGIVQLVKEILDAPVDSEIKETPMLPAKEALSAARADSRKAPSGASGTLTDRCTGRVASPEVSDGSTANYYELPKGATELQDLISYKNLNAQIGEIFRKCYRYGQVSHSEKLRDAKGIKYYIEAEIARLESGEMN